MHFFLGLQKVYFTAFLFVASLNSRIKYKFLHNVIHKCSITNTFLLDLIRKLLASAICAEGNKIFLFVTLEERNLTRIQSRVHIIWSQIKLLTKMVSFRKDFNIWIGFNLFIYMDFIHLGCSSYIIDKVVCCVIRTWIRGYVRPTCES